MKTGGPSGENGCTTDYAKIDLNVRTPVAYTATISTDAAVMPLSEAGTSQCCGSIDARMNGRIMSLTSVVCVKGLASFRVLCSRIFV